MRATNEAYVASLATVLVVMLGLLPAVMKGLGVQEPYPALTMPGFDGSPLRDGEVVYAQRSIAAIDAEGGEHPVDQDALLSDVPVIRNVVLDSAFAEGLDADGDLVNPRGAPSLFRLVLAGLPGGQTRQGTARAFDERTREWLAARLQEVMPQVDVVAVRFTTEVLRVQPATPDEVTDRETVQVVTVPLVDG